MDTENNDISNFLFISEDFNMLFAKMKKGLGILLFCLVLPVNAFADSSTLWDKLTVIAAGDWVEVDSLNEQDLAQLTSLSNSGDSNAQYALGVVYMLRHEHDKADIWLQRAAEQGHIPASYSYNENAASHAMMAGLGW